MKRLLALSLILGALLLPQFADATACTTSPCTTSNSLTATISPLISVSVTPPAIAFGSIIPSGVAAPCVQKTQALANDSVVSITTAGSWNVGASASTATGTMLNGTVATTNPVQFLVPDTGSAVTTFTALTSGTRNAFAASQAAGTATAGTIVHFDFQFCGSTSDTPGNYTLTVNYVATTP